MELATAVLQLLAGVVALIVALLGGRRLASGSKKEMAAG
jgi:hypothetical protein